jgi:hypothetical protein
LNFFFFFVEIFFSIFLMFCSDLWWF